MHAADFKYKTFEYLGLNIQFPSRYFFFVCTQFASVVNVWVVSSLSLGMFQLTIFSCLKYIAQFEENVENDKLTTVWYERCEED